MFDSSLKRYSRTPGPRALVRFSIAAVLLTQFAARAEAQGPPDGAWRLLVGIQSDYGDGFPEKGAGIVVGESDEHLLIATAWHVVTSESDPYDAIRMDLQFRDGGTMVVDSPDVTRLGDVDLALVRISKAEARAAGFQVPDWDRRARPRSLRRDDRVYATGCPASGPELSCFAALPSENGRVSTPDLRDQVTFIGDVEIGHSGGALFNDAWEVVGLIFETGGASRADAWSISRVLDDVERLIRTDLGDPSAAVRLTTPATPRGGYTTSLGVMWMGDLSVDPILASNGQDLTGTLESRLPSGRLTYQAKRPGTPLTWHIGAMRLAPPNLAVTAGVLGAGWPIRVGRLALRPFAEVGAGRVEARILASEYTLVTGSGEQIQPIWRTEQQTGVGFGGGMEVDLMIGGGIILTGSVATWRFESPEGSPDLPALSVGAGFRLGR